MAVEGLTYRVRAIAGTDKPSCSSASTSRSRGLSASRSVVDCLELLNPAGMGYGDVKLSGVIGMALAWLGWPVLLLGAALAFVLSAAVSLVLLVLRRVTLKSTLPFGPFMLLGTFAAVLLS